MWETSLSLFEQMEKEGVLRDDDCFNGAIWACVSGGENWNKAVELLKLMKFEGVKKLKFFLSLYFIIFRL